MASSESGLSSSNQDTESKGIFARIAGGAASTGYQVATSTVQGVSGTVSKLLNFGYKTQEETSAKDHSGDMAQQTGGLTAQDLDRFSTRDAGDGFLDVSQEGDDDDTALGQAIKECDTLRKKQASNLRKIAELERRLKNKDAELQAMKEQASSKPIVSGRQLSTILTEKDSKIRFLERQLEHAKAYEEQITKLTIEVTEKDEEISQLKGKGVPGPGKSQVQEPQSVKELTVELEKWRNHSRTQSRQVLSLKQELDATKLEAEERIKSLEGLLDDTERENSSQMDDPEAKCPKRACTDLRKMYNAVVAESAKLRKKVASFSVVHDDLAKSEKKRCEQKKIIDDLRESIEIVKTQAASNKADFEEERRDRTRAHSKINDLESKATKAKSQFDEERAAYKEHITSLQRDLSSAKKELKQEQAHSEKYKKKIQEATIEKARLEKELTKRNNAYTKLKTEAESTVKEYMKENDKLQAQLSQAAKSMSSMPDEMRDKKGKKKTSSEDVISKGINKFKKALSAKTAERNWQALEQELKQAERLIDDLCEAIADKEEELRQILLLNKEMAKTLTARPKRGKKTSQHQYTESNQLSSLEEPEFSFPDMDQYNEGSEEHTAGLGHMSLRTNDSKQPPIGRLPSTTATREDQLSPLPPAAGTHPLLGEQFKGDSRRSSDPALSVHKFSSSSAQDKQPLRALQPQPQILRYNSTPDPQGSSSHPLRAYVTPPPAANPSQDPTSQQSALTRSPLRAGGVPPPAVNVSNQSGSDYQCPPGVYVQPHPSSVQKYEGDRLTPGVKVLPKMHSAEQQRQEIPVDPRTVHSQPQQVQQQIKAKSNVTPGGPYPQGGQQLQTPGGRPHVYSDCQQYASSGRDASYQPETGHTPHSHPIPTPAGQQHHSSGVKKPAAAPRRNVPHGSSSQTKVPASELYNQADLQPEGNAALQQQLPPNKLSADYVNFEVVQEMAQESQQKAQHSGSTNPPPRPPKAGPTCVSKATQKPTVSQPSPLSAESLPQGSNKLPSDVDPNESLGDQRFANRLQDSIDTDIAQHVAEVKEQVSSGREREVTNTDRPYDPNLVCPMCNKAFRIGEIQKFRAHVNQCEGKDAQKKPATSAKPQGSQRDDSSWV